MVTLRFKQAVRTEDGKVDRIRGLFRVKRVGAAVVEFAVVAPVFILLVFGMIEFGRMVMVQQVIVNASREGARLAVLEGTTTQDVRDAVESYLENSSINTHTMTVTPDPPDTAGFGEAVTVTVNVPFSAVSWIPTPIYLGGRTLTASSVMRRETLD